MNFSVNFAAIAAQFSAAGAGTDAFKSLYKALYQFMSIDKANAALYFVVATAAHAYVLKFEDQQVSNDFAEAIKARFVGYNQQISAALAADSSACLAVASAIAIDYELNTREF